MIKSYDIKSICDVSPTSVTVGYSSKIVDEGKEYISKEDGYVIVLCDLSGLFTAIDNAILGKLPEGSVKPSEIVK